MPKAPLAKEAKRKDRHTRIASGPAPLPPPVSSLPGPPKLPTLPKSDAAKAAAKAAARAKLKKTQMIMGAPPLPPAVTGKTQVPSGPGATAMPGPKAPPAVGKVKAKPRAGSLLPIPDPSLPSDQKTVVGLPAPSLPTPEDGPTPEAVQPATSDELMAQLMEGSLFSEDFEDDQSTQLHQPMVEIPEPTVDIGLDATPSARARATSKPKTQPTLKDTLSAKASPVQTIPPRPVSGPAPRATGRSDTMPAAQLRNGATNPQSIGVADTQFDLDGGAAQDPPDRAPTELPADRASTDLPAEHGRNSRAGTAMQGTEGLAAPPSEGRKLRLVPGKMIPGTRYEIRRWLGEGGMGVVYEVAHADIERRSALKILRFDLSHQPQMAQVFRDEARAASRLGSPYIVEVYDFGELPDGRLYFAMDLLEGVDLVPADEETAMEHSRVIGILRQVCKGLAKAHEADVVHRDVKPENIIISEIEGRADSVKIVDFGISAMLAAGKARVGIAGTPHYMAPEQILGEDFDGRLDVYALGCTAYELMVGKPPFDADEVEDVLKQQVNAPPKAPSEMRPDLTYPPDLEAVIMRCLAKKPGDRYANMAELEAALCEAQIAAGITTAWDDLPVPVLPDEERYQRIVDRMPSPNAVLVKRSWLWPIVAGVSTLAAASLAAYLAFGRQPTEEQRDQVEQLTIEARDAASKNSWLIPPAHIETNDTALRKIVQLEDVEGRAESIADDRAEELRHEFATTLIGHGDGLWNDAKGVARQYYAWSLAFEPDNDYANERADIDAFTLSEMRRNAIAGNFNATQTLYATTAAMQVEEDPLLKKAMEEAYQEKRKDADMSPMALAQLDEQAVSVGIDVTPKRGSGAKGSSGRNGSAANNAPPKPVAPVEEPPEGGDDDDVVLDDGGGDEIIEEEDPLVAAGRKKRRRQVDMGLDGKRAKSNPARSKELTAQADSKRKQGLRNEAKSLYGQAIAANPKNGAAHLGLAQVHFDLASYDKARKSALQAVKYAPRNGRAHKVLGDAYYKAFRYQEAEGAYEEAKRHGVNVGKRLTDVRKKLGK